jgi:hypothetical protein
LVAGVVGSAVHRVLLAEVDVEVNFKESEELAGHASFEAR